MAKIKMRNIESSKRLKNIEVEIFELLQDKDLNLEKIKKNFPNRASLKTINELVNASPFFDVKDKEVAFITTKDHGANIDYNFTYNGDDNNASIKIDGRQGEVGKNKKLSGIKLYGPRYILKAEISHKTQGQIWNFEPLKIMVSGRKRVMIPKSEKKNERYYNIENKTKEV